MDSSLAFGLMLYGLNLRTVIRGGFALVYLVHTVFD